MGARCKKCGKIQLPPRPICSECHNTDLIWVEFEGRGKLLTYTIINVAPKKFEYLAPPYIVGVVKLDDGPQLLSIIRGVQIEKLEKGSNPIGINLAIDFEETSNSSLSQWPRWPRYYFKPL